MDRAVIHERDNHRISRKHISPNALKALYKLRDAGFHSFLVGGSVRDLLLENKPKDFDVATNATPEELKKIFRNARIIGRRFKIVHLRYGREIIEVTTFRAPHEAQNKIQDDVSRRQIKNLDSAHSTAGMILRDNVYGNIDEDALRRDFTVNALYYTTDKFRILDFCSGMQDLNDKQIRMIGDPEERYKEDPVRMLRAIRFSAKLGFEIEENTKRPINKLAPLLESISPARLFDETLKLLTNGHAVRTFELLREYAPGKYLFEPTLSALESAEPSEANLLQLALRNTDSRLAEGKSVTPYFLFAAILWPALKQRLSSQDNTNMSPLQALQIAADNVISRQLGYTSIPKRFTLASRDIWNLQLRLEKRDKRSVDACFSHQRFRAAYDFLLLREEAGEDLGGIGKWWTDFQDGDAEQRAEMVADMPNSKTRKRRRRKPKTSSDTE